MEIIKRCQNCGYYRFCKERINLAANCNKWIKRERGLKLESFNKCKYEFKNIGENNEF